MNGEEYISIKGRSYAVYTYPGGDAALEPAHLIMLHGFMGSARAFDPLIPLLKAHYTITAIDLLGHGKTGGSGNAEQYYADKQIGDLHAVVTSITSQTSRPVFIYGYSMGGRLAMRFAIRFPHLLDHLILESASPGIISEKERDKRFELDKIRAGNILQDFQKFATQWEQAPLFHNPAGTAKDEEIKAYRHIQRAQNPASMAACLKGFSPGIQEPVYKELARLKRPISLIAGEHDRKYSQLYSDFSHGLPQSGTYIISDAAHRVHLDQPEQIAAILKEVQQS